MHSHRVISAARANAHIESIGLHTARGPMDHALYLSILNVMGYVTTIGLPVAGFLLWLKLAFLVSGPGGTWFRISGRAKLLLLAVLCSPIVFGWVIARLLSSA